MSTGRPLCKEIFKRLSKARNRAAADGIVLILVWNDMPPLLGMTTLGGTTNRQ